MDRFASDELRLTAKQMEILRLIRRGNPDESFIDLDQLLERLSYRPSKQSMQFSIRALIKRGLIEKKGLEIRRGAKRITFCLTPKGYRSIRMIQF
ncbi:MarR family transcriptional regulator [Methylocaldum szegediense]|uniref:MarR family transcriptional regulator n=1 Tax=Methylocaldum szegediense TaxID=73780 RepID=UPI000425D0EB|nr:MarR family transcriptional regulator [Methylocaldum szegediense]